MTTKDKKHVLDQKASDNEYLHKDFHGALGYTIRYLDETFGPEATREYLQQVGRTCFGPLIEKVKAEGLPAIEQHFREVMDREDGEYTFSWEGDTLVLRVTKCPAVAHMKKNGAWFTDRFCETTVVVNETICREAGYACSCEYETGEGRCVQTFRKGEQA